jgi:hypothetical protein
MQLLKANVRDPQACEGDLLGQIAATKAGEKAHRRALPAARQGCFHRGLGALHDLSEIEMREAIRELPDGVYEGEDYLDDGGAGGEPARIHVKITIAGDEATFDLSGSSDRVSNFCNTTPFIARSAVAYSARIMSGRDMQQNAGALAAADHHHASGLDSGAGWTAAVAAGNHETSMRIVDAIFRAMQDAIPERLSAGGTTTASVLFFAEPRSDGSWKMLYEVHGGGEGARYDRDGVSATRVHLANTSNTPAEVIEANYRIRVEQQSIRRGVRRRRKISRRRRRGAFLSDSRAVHAPDHMHRADGDTAVRHAGRQARRDLPDIVDQGRYECRNRRQVESGAAARTISSPSRAAAAAVMEWRKMRFSLGMSKLRGFANRRDLNAGADSAPLTVVGGEGVYFQLEDGRRLIDGSNTGGGLGHRHPAMVEAIRRAADTPVVNEGWTWIGREQKPPTI